MTHFRWDCNKKRLLTYAGSIGTLSVAAVLMYQAAWSALSLAVCALKQH